MGGKEPRSRRPSGESCKGRWGQRAGEVPRLQQRWRASRRWRYAEGTATACSRDRALRGDGGGRARKALVFLRRTGHKRGEKNGCGVKKVHSLEVEENEAP